MFASLGRRALSAGALLLFVASPASGQKKGDPLAGLDASIEKVRESFHIAGLAVGIVRNDSLIYAKGFGEKEIGKGDRVTPTTVFAIGSNTKSFTATAAAMLVDDGKLRWDDKVTRWLPGFQLYDPYITRELTMRDVLSHRSGWDGVATRCGTGPAIRGARSSAASASCRLTPASGRRWGTRTSW